MSRYNNYSKVNMGGARNTNLFLIQGNFRKKYLAFMDVMQDE